jgi:hypothetical protein
MRTLLLDIETAPNVAHVWDLWNQNIGLNQLLESGYVLCFAAKWIGEKSVVFSSVHDTTPRRMLAKARDLLSQADAVVTWNGVSFDIPTLNREFLRFKMRPPAPFEQIDLFLIAKRRFRFVSNKLEHVVKLLSAGRKIKHEGHELWIKCMAGDKRAWKHMRRYNINDAVILERVYERLLPWISDHPHVGLREGRPESCPNCGGEKLQARGFSFTRLGKFRRFACRDCGTWTRSNKRIAGATMKGVA